MCKRSGTQKYFIFKVTAFAVKRLRKHVGRLNIFFTLFSKLYFSTSPAVKIEQFLYDRFKILTVFVKLNYLPKYVGFFRYVEYCSNYKAFSTIFLRAIFF